MALKVHQHGVKKANPLEWQIGMASMKQRLNQLDGPIRRRIEIAHYYISECNIISITACRESSNNQKMTLDLICNDIWGGPGQSDKANNRRRFMSKGAWPLAHNPNNNFLTSWEPWIKF